MAEIFMFSIFLIMGVLALVSFWVGVNKDSLWLTLFDLCGGVLCLMAAYSFLVRIYG